MIRYWMDQGADGFRMDAVPYMFEDEQFLDEPLSGNGDDEDVSVFKSKPVGE